MEPKDKDEVCVRFFLPLDNVEERIQWSPAFCVIAINFVLFVDNWS